jgi:hypothetical protein
MAPGWSRSQIRVPNTKSSKSWQKRPSRMPSAAMILRPWAVDMGTLCGRLRDRSGARGRLLRTQTQLSGLQSTPKTAWVPQCKKGAPQGAPSVNPPTDRLVSVMLRLIRPFLGNPKIISLLITQRGQLHSKLLQVQPRHFLIQMLGQKVHAQRITIGMIPKLDLSQNLVGKRGTHHKA